MVNKNIEQKTALKIRSIPLITVSVLAIAIYAIAILPRFFLPVPESVPLVIFNLSEVHTDVFDHPFGHPEIPSCNTGDIVFYSSNVDLGRLKADKESCESPYIDGLIYSGRNTPLKVLIENGDIFLDQHLTIHTENGNDYTLCLPKLTNGQIVYFDNEGTPYTDIKLTQRIINESCKTQLSGGMVINVYDAGKSAVYPNGFDYHALVRGSFNYPDIWEFGYLFGDDRGFDREAMCGDCYSRAYGNAPLAIAPHPTGSASFPLIVPADIVTVWNVTEEVKNICLPLTFLPGNPGDSEVYYLSEDGTAYEDAFLTIKAMAEDCELILGRGAIPKQVISANTTILPDQAAIAFTRGDIYDPRLLGWLRWDEGWIEGDLPLSSVVLKGGAPLVIALQNLNSEEVELSWPQQELTIITDIGEYRVCIPEQVISAVKPLLFYLGNDGLLYQDVFLQEKIIC